MPSCSGCLCSVAAINSSGLTGQSSEAPVVWAHDPEREKEIFELGLALGGGHSWWMCETGRILTLDETLWDMNGYEDVMASCIEDGTFTRRII